MHELFNYEIGDLKDPNSTKCVLLSNNTLFNSYASSYISKNFPNIISNITSYAKENPDIIPYINKYPQISQLIYLYPKFGEWVVKYDLHNYATPRLAIDANDLYDERKVLIRSEHGYINWDSLDNIFTHDDFEYVLCGITPTSNYVSKIGNTKYSTGTIIKFFIPQTMPTGYSKWFADYIDVRINGTQIYASSSYHNNRVDVPYDFSGIINLDRVNYMVTRWYGTGNHGYDFGLLG